MKDYPDQELLLSAAFYYLGEEEFNKGNFDEAVYAYSNSHPGGLAVTHRLLQSYNRLRRYGKADSVIRAAGAGPELQLFQAHDLRDLFDHTRNDNPDHVLARRAAMHLEKYLDRRATDTENTWWLGNTYVAMREFKRGEEYIARAFRTDTTRLNYRLDYAEVSIFNGNTTLARTLLNDYQLRMWRITGATRNLTLMLFYRNIVNLIEDKPEPDVARELDRLLNGRLVIPNWYLDSFQYWLNNSPHKNNERIRDLTHRLEGHIELR